MTIDYLCIGKRIREYRHQKHLSQARLSELINISPSYISYIENGLKFMSLETLIKIANALGVTADMLLADYLDTSLPGQQSYLSSILDDCSQFECKVIIETILSLKESIRADMHLVKKNIPHED